ncbi:hypothetical protein [Selenomonas sp. AB3002]|uniref:hypothetical protein n=1 Tax=Selenomonas sp. AB3002 TaxID=1392502 RepID=UPI000690871C
MTLPKDIAYDFLLFAQRNPRPCPLLEVSDTGERLLKYIAREADIATDIPKYRIYEQGELKGEYENVVESTCVLALRRDTSEYHHEFPA